MDVIPIGAMEKSDELVAAFEAEFIAALESGDDFAARELAAAGWPVYYTDEDTPAGTVIKRFPDGRRQLVSGWGAKQRIVRDLGFA